MTRSIHGDRPWWHHQPVDRLHVRAAVAYRLEDAGHIVLMPDRFRSRWSRFLQRWLPAERRTEEFRLDDRGTIVWQALLDDKNTVQDIITAFGHARPEDFAQAETRVLQFLGGLAQEGFVEFVAVE